MFSLSEIESQCKKATRGAGLSWGIAEEAGILARNLCEVGLPGPDAIYKNLKCFDDSEVTCVKSSTDMLVINGRPLSGLLVGIFVVDRLYLAEKGRSWSLGTVVGPLAIVGILLRLTETNYSFFLEWENCKVQLTNTGFKISGRNTNPQKVEEISIHIKKSEQISKVHFFETCIVSDFVWAELSRMAERTYVTASETSRDRGAGAGILDYD